VRQARANDPKKSQLYFEKALQLNPNNIQVLYFLAALNWNLRQYEACFAVVDKILIIDDKPFHALLHKSALLLMLGKPEEGQTLLAHIMAEYPQELAAIYYSQATAYSLLGQKDEALSYLQKSINEDAQWFHDRIKTDEDFNSLKNIPEFKTLIAKAPSTSPPKVDLKTEFETYKNKDEKHNALDPLNSLDSLILPEVPTWIKK
jgi:tetratricopeptide (TPR) repeat protein